MRKLFENFRAHLKEDDIDEITAAKKRGIDLPDTVEMLKKYLTDTGEDASHFVHFSDLNKLGINPKSTFNTPIGIYAYPLTKDILKDLAHARIPFASDRRYVHVFRAKNPERVLVARSNSQGMEPKDFNQYLHLLGNDPKFAKLENYSQTLKRVRLGQSTFPKFEDVEVKASFNAVKAAGLLDKMEDKKTARPILSLVGTVVKDVYRAMYKKEDPMEAAFQSWRIDSVQKYLGGKENVERAVQAVIDYIKSKTEEGNDPDRVEMMYEPEVTDALVGAAKRTYLGQLWNLTRVLSEKNAKVWAYMLAMLGVDGVVDYGTGLIHNNEPEQAVFFSKSAIVHVDSVVNKQRPHDIDRRMSGKLAIGAVFGFSKKLINWLAEQGVEDMDKADFGNMVQEYMYANGSDSTVLNNLDKVMFVKRDKLTLDDLRNRKFKVVNEPADNKKILLDDTSNKYFLLESWDFSSFLSIMDKIGHEKVEDLVEKKFADYGADKGDWVNIPSGDFKQRDADDENLADEVFDLIDFSYSKIGGHLKIRSPNDLPGKYSGWIAVDTDGDPDPDAVRFSRKNRAGTKLTGGATDGTEKGKKAFLKKTIELLHTPGTYGEMSDAIAHILLTYYDVPVVEDERLVSRILHGEIEWVGENPNGKYPGVNGWYIRRIAGKKKMKIMLGRPKS